MLLRTLFNFLKPEYSRMPVRQARRGSQARRSAACRLAVEAPEDRSVPASLTVNDVTLVEGNAGTQNAVVAVELSAPSTKTVTVNYNTANGTSLAGSDYQAVSGTLTFAPGVTSKSILVPMIGDRLGEPNEYLYVNLHGAKHATIADGRGVATIVDDEPRISITDVSGAEGNDGTTSLTFNVTLSAPCDQAVTVNYGTADGTALVGSDYQAASGTLMFAPGETSKTVTVLVTGDRVAEPNETFFVNLSGASTNALIADGQGVGTVLDDEPRISIDNVSAAEGSYSDPSFGDYPDDYSSPTVTYFTFTVSLSVASAEPVTVNFASSDGTATTADNDYMPIVGTLTFAPGETTKTITVAVIMDFNPEPGETFFVNLSGATGAVIATGQGIGTILDDDGWTPPPPPPPVDF